MMMMITTTIKALEFGALVSTSNEFADPTGRDVIVTVENSDPLIWTTAIKEAWQQQRKQPPASS